MSEHFGTGETPVLLVVVLSALLTTYAEGAATTTQSSAGVTITDDGETYTLANGMFGQSVQPLSAAQPTLPPGDKRPPLQENTPCETQPAITNLSAPTSAAIHNVP